VHFEYFEDCFGALLAVICLLKNCVGFSIG
jgi:hypothetical protein